MTQDEALDLLLMGHNIYLTGQAGSGKTFLLNRFIDFLKKNKVLTAVTATTGIAATYLSGMTIHSWSGMGIKSEITPKDLARIGENPNIRKRVEAAKVLIIDEISMLHSYRLETLNRICKKIRKNEQAFGGLQVILCGDFFQLPPVDETGYPPQSYAFKSPAWEELQLHICYLDEQHRQWDEDYLNILNDIRSSEVCENTIEKLMGRLNINPEGGVIPTRLYTHNIDVDAINNAQLKQIDAPEHVFLMREAGYREMIAILKKGCLAQELTVLKEGAAVMYVKNNPSKGYVNGTLGKIVGWDGEGYPMVLTSRGNIISAAPTSWNLQDNDDSVLAEVSQVPLRLAWAITVHKSQGMSLDAAEIDLSKSFTYGMGYVALSRVRSLAGVKLLGINQMAMMVNQEIREMDRALRQISRSEARELAQMTKKEVITRQKKHLEYLLFDNLINQSGENKILKLLKNIID